MAPLVAVPMGAPFRRRSSMMKATPVAPLNRQNVLMNTSEKMSTMSCQSVVSLKPTASKAVLYDRACTRWRSSMKTHATTMGTSAPVASVSTNSMR